MIQPMILGRVEPSWSRQCWKRHNGGGASRNSSGGL
ncbi:unnamed protein product [Spirodela intermedia]|uniref:Uncharacterized protein n=1 Tax=Spirodela intermedia TaxID=51605 RepID=A0A7I8L618_SPIIN|nr:unnamed protein product [Spirodela intermedia]